MRPPASRRLSPFGAASQAMGQAPGFPAGLVDLLTTSDLDEGEAFLAWQLAALASGLTEAERDGVATLLGRLLAAQAAGSTRLALAEPEQALLAKAPELVGNGRPLLLEEGFLYTARAHACEVRVAARLAERMAPDLKTPRPAQRGEVAERSEAGEGLPVSWLKDSGHRPGGAPRVPSPFSPSRIEHAVEEAAALGLPAPSDQQRAAVKAALGRRLGVISGGPGTGKTTIALLLVRSLGRLGVPAASIALAAPTGKAKSRLEEDFRTRLGRILDPPQVDRDLLASCPEAQTLHHMLGVRPGPGGLPRAGRDPLPYRAVIVDESSMIDLVLMDKLLEALPAASQMVLLGDADQLPSVAAGAVFRDLGAIASRLDRGFRADPAQLAGSQLAALAKEVRAGAADAAAALCVPRDKVDELRRQGAEHLAAEQRDQLLRQHHARLFDVERPAQRVFTLRGEFLVEEDGNELDELAARMARTRVLAVTRQGIAGVERVNAFLHDLHDGGTALVPGEPVLMLHNDYERELWNGDQGIVVRAARPGRPAATLCAFHTRKGWLAVDPFTLGSAVSLAYALTVHKAQGSEYDEVLLLLPDYECPLLSRELVYTAISRARSSVIVCGDLDRFKAGVSAAEKRSSGIGERLALEQMAT